MLIKIRDDYPTTTIIRGRSYSPGGVYDVDENVAGKLKSRCDENWKASVEKKPEDIPMPKPFNDGYQTVDLHARFAGGAKQGTSRTKNTPKDETPEADIKGANTADSAKKKGR